jgi:outer membrane protein assembly factor BamD (BamD/ComL family)
VKKIYLYICVAVLFSSCATQKSKSDQSGFSKFYHNTNAKFNGYFNANELLEESVAQLDLQHSDNYNEILPIYKYRASTNPESVASSLDEAIKKVSVVATIHDYSIWVDDCYLLIGKADYLKQDFESAENALEFFMHEFERDGSRSSKSSAKKKKKKGPSSSKKKSSAKSDSKKESDKRAKQAEKERKAYNKELRRKQKRSQKGKSTDGLAEKPKTTDNVASKRNTTRSAPTPEAQPKPEKDEAAKQENPSSIKHRPAYQEAQLWLARTYIERENYPRVEYHLGDLRGNPYLQEEVRVQMPAGEAYYAIQRSNYKGAIPHLEEAIKVTKKKADRARYAYIIAQIMDMEDETSGKSYEWYKQAYDYHPNYELSFNAQLSMARTAYLSGDASLKESIILLEKMLADDKNAEFKDKLYYTYARIDLFLNDTDAAIGHLNEAIINSGSNQAQQTETYYLLATLYFDKGMYIEAKATFDSALQTMSKEDDRLEMAQLMSENLTDIAKHLSTIVLQDSLLGISAMSEDEKLALAKDIKAQRKIAAVAAKAQNSGGPVSSNGKGSQANKFAASSATAGNPVARPVNNINNAQSSFFAYDDRASKRGARDFDRIWGDRPLSDNWRVKSVQAAAPSYAGSENPDLFQEDVIDEEDLADYFKDVPSTEEEIGKAHEAIQNAMLQLGSLYREKLEDPALSAKVLEELIARYPESVTSLEAYYQLYLSYLLLNNDAKAEQFKNLIIQHFPDSKYALALSDPDYINRQLTEERKLELQYEGIYDLVQEGKYEQAMSEINLSRATYGTQHDFQSKIAIMEAMCIGNLQGRDEYIAALKNVVSNYPNSPEETKARDMLLLLGAYKNNRLNLQKSDAAGGGPRFRAQPNGVHYMLVSINNFEEINTKDAKISVSNYNRKYHKLDRLKISSLVFDPTTGQSLILVRSFKNSVEAMKYYENIHKHKTEFLPEAADFEVFPVSQFNYREIIKERSLESYRGFFEEQYVDD